MFVPGARARIQQILSICPKRIEPTWNGPRVDSLTGVSKWDRTLATWSNICWRTDHTRRWAIAVVWVAQSGETLWLYSSRGCLSAGHGARLADAPQCGLAAGAGTGPTAAAGDSRRTTFITA